MRLSECLAVASLCLILAAPAAFAAAPGLMSYQGILTDGGGAVVADGDYSVTFAIYADSVTGNPLWSETRTVPVADGLFNEMLGSVNALTAGLFAATPRWMGMTVENDSEMTPRLKIGSVPWALRAAVADSALVVAGGAGAGDGHSLDASDGDPVDAVYVNYAGFVGVGTTSPSWEMHIHRDVNNPVILLVDNPSTEFNASANLGFWTAEDSWAYINSYPPTHGTMPGTLQFRKHGAGANMRFALNNVEHIRIDTIGNVGIGTWAPEYKLDVNGTANMDGFRMAFGSGAGRVLTSDAVGNGTWQTPAGAADGDWTISGIDMYSAVSGNVGIGTTAPLHHLHLVGSDTLGSMMIAPALTVNEHSEILLAEDNDGTFGMFLRYNGSINLLELGGWSGTTEYGPHMTVARDYPIFEFDGSAGTIQFNLGATGSSSVTLPNNAVGAAEILDEPGVADSIWTGSIQYIGTSPTVLISRSITCPAAGYVLAVGTAWVQWFVNSSSAWDCFFALSDQSSTLPDPAYRLTVPGGMAWGTYNQPVNVHRLFPVGSAGTYTFYYLAQEQVADFTTFDKELTLVYIPTAYGNVTAPAAADPMTVDPDAVAERAETEAFNAARIEREMSELRADVEALREKMRTADDR